jgi:hypothetical protein
MKKYTPDYPKIIIVGIPIGFLAWFILIFPSVLLSRSLGVADYRFYISIFLTIITMSIYFYFCVRFSNRIGASILLDPSVLSSPEGHLKCSFCSAEIRDLNSAKIWQQSITGKNKLCCLNCWEKRCLRSYKSLFVYSLIVITFGIFSVVVNPNSEFGWIILNLYLATLFGILMIIPHELSHAYSARLLGMHVAGIIIGIGKTVFVKRFWGFSWEFKNIPIIGITLVLNLKTNKYRSKQFAMILAGPLTNLVVISVLLGILPRQELFTGIFDLNIAPASALFWANIIDFFGNLIPRMLETIIGKIPNDGLNLASTLFLSKKEIEQKILYHKELFIHLNKDIPQ